MEHVQDFISKTKPLAIKVQVEYGVPYGVCIAQAALETGWGRHVKGNNYFGIKGQGQEFATHEFVNGKRVDIVDSFRAYKSMEDSFLDYGLFLRTNQRYSACFLYTNDPERFAKELQNAGYATDPEYAEKLIQIMRRWGLEPIVLEVKNKPDFPDVQENHWARDAIECVVQAGLMRGDSDGTFNPSSPVTRAELAVVLQRSLRL